MLTRKKMEGIYVLPPTPFKKDGSFDEESFRENVRKLADAGVHAVVTTGSVGEFHTITWDDHKRLIKALVEETKAKGIVGVAGCSGVNTDEAIKKVKFAEECGADAIMNVSPYYVNLTRRELVKFWQDLSEACPNIGLIVYNNPGTAQLHDVDTFKELAKLPNMCGSKEAHYDFSLWYSLNRETDLAHMTATEITWFVPTMKLGAKGVFSMSASMIPNFIMRMYRACKEGRWDEATDMQFKLRELWKKIESIDFIREYHSIVRFKAIVNAFGVLKCGVTRRPFIPLPDDIQKRLTDYVQENFSEYMN